MEGKEEQGVPGWPAGHYASYDKVEMPVPGVLAGPQELYLEEGVVTDAYIMCLCAGSPLPV